MKLIIELKDSTYEKIKALADEGGGERYNHATVLGTAYQAIAKSKPYEERPSGDLISREALKKKLQARHDNGEEDFDKGYNIGIEAAIELIDNAQAVDLWQMRQETTENALKKAREADRWISVKERMPESRVAVMVYCPERQTQYCAFYADKHWQIFGSYDTVWCEVTHWKPLPKAPESEGV